MRINAVVLLCLSLSACSRATSPNQHDRAVKTPSAAGSGGGGGTAQHEGDAGTAGVRPTTTGGTSSAGVGPTTTAGSGGASGQGEVMTMATVSTWVTDLTTAYCTWAVRCDKFPNVATCKVSVGHEFSVVNFNVASAAVTSVSDGKAQFDAAQATSCLTTLSNLDCDVELLNLQSIPAPCSAAFSGSLADGSTCIDDVECANGSLCRVVSTVSCEGTCTSGSGGRYCRTNDDCSPQQFCSLGPFQGSGLWGWRLCETSAPPGGAGDVCGTPVQCAPGLSCAGGPAPARCIALAGEGEHCGMGLRYPGAACAPNLACVLSDDNSMATCMTRANLGDPCTSLFQCGAQYHQLSDIICDEITTHTCVHKPSTGSCIVFEGINTCDPNTSYCERSATGATCKPWLEHGEPCAELTYNGVAPCGIGNTCLDGTCAPEPGACIPK
jgi:hypothetical protein